MMELNEFGALYFEAQAGLSKNQTECGLATK